MAKEIITKVRVRFYECDYYQHVNNAVYVGYLDVGVADFFKELYPDIKKLNFVFHMVHVSADFKGGATFDDNLIIKTKVAGIGNTSITFEQIIQNENTGEILVAAKKIGVFLSLITGQKTEVPKEIKDFFNS